MRVLKKEAEEYEHELRQLKRKRRAFDNIELKYCGSRIGNKRNSSHLGPKDELRDADNTLFRNRKKAYLKNDDIESQYEDDVEDEDDVEGEEDEDGNGSGINRDDLQYMVFLENIREDGNYYVLEIPVRLGVSMLIRYEMEIRKIGHGTNEARAVINRPKTDDTKSASNGLRTQNGFRKRNNEPDEVTESFLRKRKERKSSMFKRNAKVEGTHHVSSEIRDSEVRRCSDEVPEKNAETPKHHVSSKSRLNGKRISPPEVCSDEVPEKNAETPKHHVSSKIRRNGKIISPPEVLLSAKVTHICDGHLNYCMDKDYQEYIDDLQKSLTENKSGLNDVSSKGRVEADEVLNSTLRKERKSQVFKKNVEVEGKSHVSCEITHSRTRPSLEVIPCSEVTRKFKSDMNSDNVDESSYRKNNVDKSCQQFFDTSQKDKADMVSTPGSAQQIKVENDVEEISSDSEVMVLENPFPGNQDAAGFSNSVGRSNHSLYREKLMVILQKPYDEDEYDNLLNMAYERKPREWNLQGYKKSYFENHACLERQIQSREMNEMKGLNLLRGFFYWLVNGSQEGAFKPWLDKKCVKMLHYAPR